MNVCNRFRIQKTQMAEGNFKFAATILFGNRNVDDERAGSVEVICYQDDGGRVLAAICPCPPARLRRGAGSFGLAVENVEDFLLHFAGGCHISPGFFGTGAGDKFQIVQDFAQHRFGLVLDFFDQDFLCAHVPIIHRRPVWASWRFFQR